MRILVRSRVSFLLLNGVHQNLIPRVLLIEYFRYRAAIGECGKEVQQTS